MQNVQTKAGTIINEDFLPQDNAAIPENNDQVLCISFQEDSGEHQPHHPTDQPWFQINRKSYPKII